VNDPLALLLDLGRYGELIVFLGQALAGFLDHAPDADPAQYRGVMASPLIMV
jgi:hypothetical protein